MSHCVDFWHKWKKEPNFCGLSPQSVSEIKGYLELVEKIKSKGIPEDTIYERCTSGACRPLLRVADDDTRIKGLNYVVSCLKRGEKITGGDLQSSINSWLGKETACKVPAKPAPESTQLRTDVSQAVENKTPQPTEDPKEPEPVKEDIPVVQVSVQEPPKPKPAPCRDFHPEIGKPQFVCPDLDDHLVVHKIKGRCCDVIDIPVNQLPGNECPLERRERMKGTQPEPFHRASDGLGNTFVKPPAYKITASRLPESERDKMVDALIDHTSFTKKDIEQIDELVKVNREGWSCRFDLVEAAVMMLLAKAEGA